MAFERDFPKLAINSTKIKSLSFLKASPPDKFLPKKKINNKIKTLPALNLKINNTVTESPSFFADPKNITALRREHARTRKINDRADNLVSLGLHILDNMVCLQNPSNLDPVYMNRLALAFFKQAARNGNAFGMYLEGVAKIYGFCESAKVAAGLSITQIKGIKQIEEAAKLKCAEAQNFLGLLLTAKGNFAMCCRMFRDAAYGGHPEAPINYKKVMDFRQKLLAIARKSLMRKELLLRHKRQRRQRGHDAHGMAYQPY
jgi:hypothetical protein